MIKKLEAGDTTKFSDFGTARVNTGTMANTLARGTLIYMSPELKNKIGKFDAEKCDIFSLGLSFLRLILNLVEN